jgi:hypothetical protein
LVFTVLATASLLLRSGDDLNIAELTRANYHTLWREKYAIDSGPHDWRTDASECVILTRPLKKLHADRIGDYLSFDGN